MDLKEFLEKFLPAYKAEYTNLLKELKKTDSEFTLQGILVLYPKAFPEALQNFANRICKKQRDNCFTACVKADTNKDLVAILLSEQPEIEEL